MLLMGWSRRLPIAADTRLPFSVDQMDAARLARVFATNVTGAFMCAREAVRRMSTKQGGNGGSIVNVSSGAARIGAPGEYVDYAASKGGAVEPNRVDRVKELVPMKRGGVPHEVASAILWLLSDESSFTTGAFIDVTGGK
jgi:NAD(P)-dependent dehydrogenase (short-subunit alcohol dehydrogenase family)